MVNEQVIVVSQGILREIEPDRPPFWFYLDCPASFAEGPEGG